MYKSLLVLADQKAEALQEIETSFADRYECVVARNAEEAVAAVKSHQPMAVVTDFPMPLRAGGSLAAALKADPATSQIPIVAFSSWDYPRTRATAKRIGCAAFVPRSAGVEALVTAVGRVAEIDQHALQG